MKIYNKNENIFKNQMKNSNFLMKVGSSTEQKNLRIVLLFQMRIECIVYIILI